MSNPARSNPSSASSICAILVIAIDFDCENVIPFRVRVLRNWGVKNKAAGNIHHGE
jgi:hypothetical protein